MVFMRFLIADGGEGLQAIGKSRTIGIGTSIIDRSIRRIAQIPTSDKIAPTFTIKNDVSPDQLSFFANGQHIFV